MRSSLRRAARAAVYGVLVASCDPFAADAPSRADLTIPTGITDLGAATSGSDAFYTRLAEDAPAGATRVRLVDVNVIPRGGLVLFHVAKGTAAANGDAIEAAGDLGRYSVHRVLAREQDFVKLSTPLPLALRAADTQAVRVLEGGTVSVPTGATLKAGAWGPRGGGVIAIAADVLVNDGAIAADGAGFRGAPADPQSDHRGCATAGAPNDGYAFRGEGLGAFSTDPADKAAGGSASAGIEGGGGVCHNGGGGGGGHGAGGGQGGGVFSGDPRPAGTGTGGGEGGKPIRYRLGERFLFGGGGGGGEANDATAAEIAAFVAPSGGGVIWVRARQIRGSGTFSAGGLSGQTQSKNGAYGGGAGGTVILVADDSINCALISARGGAGGASQSGGGGGGGGGGGRILVSAPTIACLGERPRGGGEGAAASGEKQGGAGGTNASLLTTPEGVVPTVPY